jgi:hypothetical protein
MKTLRAEIILMAVGALAVGVFAATGETVGLTVGIFLIGFAILSSIEEAAMHIAKAIAGETTKAEKHSSPKVSG